MNEMGFFQSFWFFIWNLIKQSYVYKILRKLYDGISGAWQRSRITTFFRKEHFSSESVKSSLFGRIIYSPFTFFTWLQKKYCDSIKAEIEGSLVIGACNTFLNNLLALNTRFIGTLAVFALLGTIITTFIMGGQPSLVLYVLVAVSVVISFFNLNITKYIKTSWLSEIFQHILGIDFDYSFYNQDLAKSNSRLILAGIIGLTSGVLGVLINPIIGLGIVFGLFALFLIMKSTRAGVYITIFLAPLLPTMPVVGLCVLSLFSLIIMALSDKNFKWKFDGLGILVLGYLVIYLISAFNSFARINSLSIVAIYFIFMMFYFVVINTIKTKKQIFDALTIFALSGALVCIYGIAQYLFGWDTSAAWIDDEMFSDIKMRVYSTLENPNVLGEYILLVLPVCIGLLWQKPKKFTKLLYSLLAGIMFATLILTFSRGCWIGFMITAGLFITFVCGKMWGLALIALPFIPMFIPESIMNRFASVGDMKDSSTSYRVYIWMGSLAMIKDFWASGIGPGTEAFKSVYPFYSYSGVVAPHSHNMFLQIMVETGIAGIGTFLAILIFFTKKMITGYQATKPIAAKSKSKTNVMTFVSKKSKTESSALGVLIISIAVGIIGFSVQGMFDNCFYNYRVFLIFWFVLALGIAAVNIAKSSSTQNDNNTNKKLGGEGL